MLARDIMSQPVITVTPDTDVAEVAKLLLEHRISGVPVVQDGRLLGVVSEGDLLRRHETGTESRRSWWLALFGPLDEMARDYVRAHGLRAGDVMTAPAVTIDEDTPVARIADLLERHGIKRLPVLRDGELVGIVSRANLLHAVAAGHGLETETHADDDTVANSIRRRIREAPWAKPVIINVTVTDGQAELWGLVHSSTQRDAMRILAERTPGVRGVTDRLQLFDRNAPGGTPRS